jgi:hypothetical protein
MGKQKRLSELSKRELEKAASRACQKFHKYREEMSRRELIERYGADNPELNTYPVWVTVEGAFDVKARSEEEAAEIIEEPESLCYGVWLDYGNVAQIEQVDGPIITIDSVEEVELEDAAE